jgi:hypothetical protein
MLLTLGTIAIVVILVLMWRQQTRERGASAHTETAAPEDLTHHAVYIKFDKKNCCALARDLGINKFLSSEAPSLPLDGCDRPGKCHCVYKHVDDRRGKRGRRNTDQGFGEPIYLGPERRSGVDRRDQASKQAVSGRALEPADYFLR